MMPMAWRRCLEDVLINLPQYNLLTFCIYYSRISASQRNLYQLSTALRDNGYQACGSNWTRAGWCDYNRCACAREGV
jgi:hypothetical protein